MIHSSLIPRGQPIPKTVMGKTRADDKDAKDKAEAAQLAAAHKVVDARDGGRCRVCARRCDPKAVSINDRAERHHMLRRRYEGAHVSSNIVTLCRTCHECIHVAGTLCVSGNADLRDARGKLCGVKVERITGDVWRVVGMV